METKLIPASTNKRFLNYILDSFWLGVVLSQSDSSSPIINISETLVLLASTIYLANFFLLEPITGKTLGKYLTQTKTVKNNGEKAGFWRITLKAFARFIPFDPFSFLSGNNPIGWHDKLSTTIVVDEVSYDRFKSEKGQSKSVTSQSNKLLKLALVMVSILLALSVGAFSVYLFNTNQAREIKQKQIEEECSLIAVKTPAVSGYPALTEKELMDKGTIEPFPTFEPVENPGTLLKLFIEEQEARHELNNRKIIEQYSKAREAIPEKISWRKANEVEFDLCLYGKGYRYE